MCGIFNTRGSYSRKYCPTVLKSKYENILYEWWREILLVYGLNSGCKEIYDSYMKFGNELMGAINFWTI